MCIECMYLLVKYRRNVDRYIGTKWIRSLKEILEVEEDRVLLRRRSFGRDVRHGNHISRILYEHPGVTMVRVIIVGSRGQHDIGIPLTYFSDDLQSYIETRYQLAVVIIEHIVSNAESLTRFLCFGIPALRKLAATFRLVTGIAVSNCYKLHSIAELRKQYRGTARILIAVVGMCADHNNADLVVVLRVE